jgi:hypothetical protein
MEKVFEALELVNTFLKCYGENDFIEVEISKEDVLKIKQALITKSKKELAWNIVIKKNVSLYWLRQSRNAKEYNIYIERFRDTLSITKEEFDLLKRYLGNE